MSTVTVATPEARVSVENHARAVLARLCGAHHLPIAPDGLTWQPAYDMDLLSGRTLTMPARLRVDVPEFADVDVWAAALGAQVENDNLIVDPATGDGTWFISRERRIVVRDWLPGVKLWVRRLEYRNAEPGHAAEIVRAAKARRAKGATR